MSIGFWGPQQLEFPDGRPAARQKVFVVNRDTDVEAPLFLNGAGTPADNPDFTDELGNLAFYVEAGDYDLLVNGARIQIQVLEPASGGTANYHHHQASPAADWIINHGLGRNPAISFTLDADLRLQYPDVTYPDLNTALADWDIPVAGDAYM